MKKRWGAKQTGFTIVELLIVIVVIAILAAITLVSYSNISRSAKDAQQLATIDAWQKSLMAVASQGGSVSDSAQAQCLGVAADYPAADGFAAGQCLIVSGGGFNTSVSYTASSFSSWTGLMPPPSGKMPITSVNIVQDGVTLTYKARGLWLVGPVTFSTGTVSIAWVPQKIGQCGRAVAALALCQLTFTL